MQHPELRKWDSTTINHEAGKSNFFKGSGSSQHSRNVREPAPMQVDISKNHVASLEVPATKASQEVVELSAGSRGQLNGEEGWQKVTKRNGRVSNNNRRNVGCIHNAKESSSNTRQQIKGGNQAYNMRSGQNVVTVTHNGGGEDTNMEVTLSENFVADHKLTSHQKLTRLDRERSQTKKKIAPKFQKVKNNVGKVKQGKEFKFSEVQYHFQILQNSLVHFNREEKICQYYKHS